MNINKIKQTFEAIGYTGNTQISQIKFQEVLNNLMSAKSNHGYDKDVSDQLWEQASGGSNYIEINRICQTIDQGINILQAKLQQINQQIRLLEKQKLQAYNSSNGGNRSSLARVENNIANLEQDRDEFQQDLRLVTIPFGINIMGRNSLRVGYNPSGSRVGAGANGDSTVFQGAQQQNDELRYVLYFSIAFAIIQIIIIYGKYDFLNILVVTSLLSIYLLNHFDNLYIKVTLVLLVASQVLDIIWMFMYAAQKWNPPHVGNDSKYQRQYLRFIVFFTIVVIGVKIPIAYFLYRIKNINDNKYVISMGLFKIILNANKSNPITRNLTNILSN